MSVRAMNWADIARETPGNAQRSRPFTDYWQKGTFKYGDVRGIAAIGDKDYSHEPNTVACYSVRYCVMMPRKVEVRTVSEIRRKTRDSRVKASESKRKITEVERMGLVANIGRDYS